MEKLKNIWKDLSKPGKIFISTVAAVILIIVLINYIV